MDVFIVTIEAQLNNFGRYSMHSYSLLMQHQYMCYTI
jgi:hypothetical protein